MPENKPFVINDRRKFTTEGELRPEAAQHTESEAAKPADSQTQSAIASQPERSNGPQAVAPSPATKTAESPDAGVSPEMTEDDLPPTPTDEETAQVTRAYDATVDRLDTAIRATNPGAERMPPMSFERLVQSLYMQSLLQLGGAAEPGQSPRVDLIGARQTIDMLAIIAEKSKGNLSETENKFLQSALFEIRMGFLEVTQALSRQAASRQPGAPGMPAGSIAGPSIVR